MRTRRDRDPSDLVNMGQRGGAGERTQEATEAEEGVASAALSRERMVIAAVQMFDLVGSGPQHHQLPGQGSNPVLEDLVPAGFSVLPVSSLVGHKTWPEPALEYGNGLDPCSHVHAPRVPKGPRHKPRPQTPPLT